MTNKLRQSDLARELDISEMTVSRAFAALGCNSRPLSDYDAFKIVFASELQNLGLASHVVIDLMADFNQEVRFVFKYSDRRTWIIFVENERASFSSAAMSESHMASLVDLFPLALVLPLHTVAERAKQRLAALKSRKAAA